MNPIPAFRARLQQINAEIAHSPIPNLAEDMAKTTLTISVFGIINLERFFLSK